MNKILLIIIFFISAAVSAQLSSRSFVPSGKSLESKETVKKISEDKELKALLNDSSLAGMTKEQLLQKIAEVKAKIDAADTKLYKVTELPTFGLSGIGNTNTETFDNINASGKLSGYIRPYKSEQGFWEVDFAFNVNASNTDSLSVNTVLFPDVGNNSFTATVMYNWVAAGEGKDYYIITPFFEFANKTITGRNDDSERKFYTLNTSFGVNLQYLYIDGNDQVSFGLSPYFATVNIPEPGGDDYRYLLTGNEDSLLSTNIQSWGAKVTFQYNNFQIFADFRTVMGDDEDFPVEGFKGFHPNLGVVVNAEIFER